MFSGVNRSFLRLSFTNDIALSLQLLKRIVIAYLAHYVKLPFCCHALQGKLCCRLLGGYGLLWFLDFFFSVR